ncbi:M20/M25/M40 family metallo-hydrolase [Candidatus Chordibacter forsetii]|uniref:M20/M25/M40 family metallo-hydrolase n=1 Tax=Candidatus Chordibacter forsetii TaxID=3381758 RepID=UPI003899948A
MEIQEIDRETALSGLLDQIPERIKKISEKRDSFLTDTVLLGEIPSPTYGEDERIRAVVDRFRENGLSAPNIDEFGNASAHLPGTEGQSSILVMAHADSVFSREVRHEIQVGSGHMSGPGIADNALGLAAMIALPRLLDDLGIRLRDDLILVANSRSLGRANLEGASGFLETMSLPARAGICVEGSTLGRLSYSGLGTLRGEITLQVPSDYDWKRFGASGAISHVTGLINQIREIPIPKEPKTQLVFGGLRCGSSFNTSPKQGTLRFEITSEDDDIIGQMEDQLNEICEQFSAETGTLVSMEVVAKRQNCSIPFTHPLVKTTRSIMQEAGITPKVDPSTGDLNALILSGLPAVTLGLTTVENLREINETVQLDPLYAGMTQLVSLIQAIDQGICDS